MNLERLHRAIRSLANTGDFGFEGFVRDVLSEVTGRTFRLMRSGPQGGVEPLDESTLKIAHEASSWSDTLDLIRKSLGDLKASNTLQSQSKK